MGKSKKGQLAKRVIAIVLIFICLGVGIVAGASLYIVNALKPVETAKEEVMITIPQGIGSAEIARLLEEHELIRSSLVFTLYLRYRQQGDSFQAGEYRMAPGMTLDSIIAKLNAGDTVKAETIRFTIPEGFTLIQITDKLADLEVADPQTLLNIANDYHQLQSEAIAHIPIDSQLKYPLEGYLFPETYEMSKGSSEQDIMNRMVQELDKKLTLLPQDWHEQLERLGIGFHEMMTLASLVEREVVVDEERPIVAGVIYNRLQQTDYLQFLQIDATVQYALGKQKERLLYEDLKVEDPYNTYLHPGLPPGPIANPSLQSIKAALYPQETKYFFYVTKKDGTQGHLFAETFEQHKKNIEESNHAGNAQAD